MLQASHAPISGRVGQGYSAAAHRRRACRACGALRTSVIRLTAKKRHKTCTRQRLPNSNTLPQHCHRIVVSERLQDPQHRISSAQETVGSAAFVGALGIGRGFGGLACAVGRPSPVGGSPAAVPRHIAGLCRDINDRGGRRREGRVAPPRRCTGAAAAYFWPRGPRCWR